MHNISKWHEKVHIKAFPKVQQKIATIFSLELTTTDDSAITDHLTHNNGN